MSASPLRRRLYLMITCMSYLVVRCHAQLSSSPTTTSTSTFPDSQDPQFIGYYLQPTTTQRLKAGDGLAWMTSGRFAGDCRTASSSCAYATECADNTLYYDDDTSTKCFEGASCVLFTILQTSPDGWPSATNYGCRVAWSAYTVYRELATITSSTSTLATHTSALATSTTTRPVASQASSTSDINTNEKSSGRKALIIGAVVGPVLALVLVAALTWFIVRQRKRRGNAAEHFVPGMNEKDNHQYGGPILASELDGRQMPVEVATAKTPRMFEMSA